LIHGDREGVGKAAGSVAAEQDEGATEGAAGRGYHGLAAARTAALEAGP